MQNPLRSEDAAFRVLLAAGGYLLLIGIGSLLGVWVGVGVFAVLTAGVAWWLLRRGHAR